MLPHFLWLINPKRVHFVCGCRLCYLEKSAKLSSGHEQGEMPVGYMPYHPSSGSQPFYPHPQYQQQPPPADYYYPQPHVINY